MKSRLLRFKELKQKVGLSRTTIWRLQKAGMFPTPRKISTRSIAWLEEDVDGWIEKFKIRSAKELENSFKNMGATS